jgi:hypothetical protein
MNGLLNAARQKLRGLGGLGIAGIVVIGAAAGFHFQGVKPLEERSADLEARLEKALAQGRATDARVARDSAPAAKLEALYGFLRAGGQPVQWLEKLDALAASSGVQLRTAEYRMQESGSRIARYEITLPLAGGYTQIRAFLRQSLEEIPVMSLDQVNFKRNGASDPVVQAEAHLTLHLVNP